MELVLEVALDVEVRELRLSVLRVIANIGFFGYEKLN